MKVVVTGGAGFLGANVVRLLSEKGFSVSSCSRRMGVDIGEYQQIFEYLQDINPSLVIHCAAHVGGIAYNEQKPIEIFEDNLKIGMNIVKACASAGIKRLINIMPNCTYPGDLEVYREEDWWNGPMHETVLTYGLPRKTMWGLSWAYKKKELLDTVHLIFPNMYGPGDHFDPVKSHALGALIKKIVTAKREKKDKVEIWGTGRPVREWLYVEDAAESILKTMEHFNEIGIEPLNIGVGKGISISEMAELIKEAVDWEGEFVYLKDRPDGAMIKILDAERMKEILKWSPPTNIKDGIKKTVRWFLDEGKSV